MNHGTTVKTLKSMSKNQIIDLILSPLVNRIEMKDCESAHLILIQNGLDAGCYEPYTTNH